MKHTSLSRILLLALFCAILSVPLLATVSAQDENAEPQTTIVLADIDNNPIKIIDRMQPLADYLADHLAEFGIESAEVMVAPDMETMINWLETGEVDIAFDSPFPAMVMINEAGAVPVLRRWKDGVEEYHAVFFALETSGLETLEDLQGHVVALDSPQSTSGYMLPKAYLLDMELNPVEVPRPTSSVADDEIGYVFTEDDEITLQWVISGRVSAGVVDSALFSELPEDTRDHLVILGETVDVPRHVMFVRPGMDEALVEAIADVMVVMHEDADAEDILDTFDTARFDLFPQGAQAALGELQYMFDLVRP